MSKRVRRIIFYFIVVVFLVASYLAVLHAQGYKYSFSERKFFRTGAITVKSNIDAKVFYQDQLMGATSFLGNNFAIDRLLPGQYQVRLQNDNTSVWQKSVTVREGYVTDFAHILLIPQDEERLLILQVDAIEKLASAQVQTVPTPTRTPTPRPRTTSSISPTPTPEPFRIDEKKNLWITITDEPEIIASNVLGFVFTDNHSRLLWFTRNELWVLWLSDTDYQPFKKQGDRELITRFSSAIQRAMWYPDDNHILVQTNNLKIIEVDTRGGTNIINL